MRFWGRKPDKLEKARGLLAARLSSIYKQWTVKGDVVLGPGTLAVRVEDMHQECDSHLDIGFVLNRSLPDTPVLWDCVAGGGVEGEEGLARAVETWAAGTLPVFLELLHGDGSFAGHYHGNDSEGCPGWHVIHGPVIAFGVGEAPQALQQWALGASLLRTIGPIAARGFQLPQLNCVKILFGGSSSEAVEVRVNGTCDEVAAGHLRAMPWPRAGEPAFARCYLLFVHDEVA
jgi:hypothetical protein